MGRASVAAYVLRLGDDALVTSHRLGEWIADAPELEEDVAIANIALDLLGQARALLTYAGEVEGAGRDEDALAYFRDERAFTNVQLCELPNGDFGHLTARMLAFSAYQHELYTRLRDSADDTLAAIAAKAVKEVAYHRDHARQWVLRLGDGTAESHRRVQAGLDAVFPYTAELFESDALTDELFEAGVAVDPAALAAPWSAYVEGVVAEATLAVPDPQYAVTGGRRGIHTEAMGYVLAEMQHLARSHPGA
ncbi:MAG: phenylacetate-CoA oxygenase subunit PaaC, partial [Propionibacteriales bacterium]|nr:phenylacetate-CoA oxygenase subunit PaaC [Propionibacteriales bacterium]